MLFSKARARRRDRMRALPATPRPRPAFCISLALPLPALGRQDEPSPAAGTAMLHLAFCSAGAAAQGFGWHAAAVMPPTGLDAGGDRDGERRTALAWMMSAIASGVGGLPLPLRTGDRRQEPSAPVVAAAAGPRACGPVAGGATAADRFTMAMQEWPIPLIAWSGRQTAFVGIMQFCDAFPGLPLPRHRSLHSRLSSADPRPPQQRSVGVESTVRKRPR